MLTALVNSGWGKVPDDIIAVSADEGTIPRSQFAGLFQSVEAEPVQVNIVPLETKAV